LPNRIYRIFQYGNPSVGDEFLLDRENTHLVTKVYRLSAGDSFILLNGNGLISSAKLVGVKSKLVNALIFEKEEKKPSSPYLTLLQSLPKGEKSKWIVQKAVEWGVYRILFFEGRYSVARAKAQDKDSQIEKWRHVATEALRQSGNPFLPQMINVLPFHHAVELSQQSDICLMFDEKGEKYLMAQEFIQKKPTSITVGIGPEGGWSDEERDYLFQHHFIGVRVGPYILRTETASIGALAILRSFYPPKG